MSAVCDRTVHLREGRLVAGEPVGAPVRTEEATPAEGIAITEDPLRPRAARRGRAWGFEHGSGR
ncbi:Uncharacterised protein [Mycobacteroides abscessus subsp. abscessus]|nr:Uncharacterised protein [Mycobacteroides abscessus subsp. abscessus]